MNVLGTQPSTIKHIPKAACVLYSNAFAQLIESLVASPSIGSLGKLMLFVRFSLAQLPRGGKRAQRQGGHILAERLNEWHASSYLEILKKLKPQEASAASEPPRNHATRLKERVKASIQEGAIAKAARELISDGLHPNSASIVRKLKDLHPQRPLPAPVWNATRAPPFECTAEDMICFLF